MMKIKSERKDSTSPKKSIRRILIANRGEIARRIIRSIHKMGGISIAVYSEVDADAPHVTEANEACFLGGSESKDSYLNMAKIIAVATANNVDAIHPGYGFLSENAEFAQKVMEAGIVWIGPPPKAIEVMGEKSQAKEQAKLAGVPVLEGVKIDESFSAEERLECIRTLGFPLLIKAIYGGGGRGIRLVECEEDFESALQTAQSEAKNAFGSGEVMLERYVSSARHIEIQVLADQYGNSIHLFERECSVQRRRQKVVEEAPSPVLSLETRSIMGETALQLLSQIEYTSAGTIEFLVDAEENFYFLEMNTRLQVEHTVTEEITGLDLVSWQIKIANGEALDIAQSDVQISGHAIQVRLYAEDPYSGFLPQSGPILQFEPQDLAGLRYDHSLHVWDSKAGTAPKSQEISTYYDAMIAKIISHGPTREVAINRLLCALSTLRCFGITTNQSYLQQILLHSEFQSADIDINWLEKQTWSRKPIQNRQLALSSVLLSYKDLIQQQRPFEFFFTRGHFAIEQKLHLFSGEELYEHNVCIESAQSENRRIVKGNFTISINSSDSISIEIADLSLSHITYVCDSLRYHLRYTFHNDGVWILENGQSYFVQEPSPFVSDRQEEDSLDISASMLGKVVAVNVSLGSQVEKGMVVCTIEAMKMEHQMCAKADGILEDIFVRLGDQVQAGQLLGRLSEISE